MGRIVHRIAGACRIVRQILRRTCCHWVNDSPGGVFYVVFWCLVAFRFPRATPPWRIALVILASTSLPECLQLWHPPFLEWIRGYPIGGILLGTTFAWSDFPYYILGAGPGWLWMRGLRRLNGPV